MPTPRPPALPLLPGAALVLFLLLPVLVILAAKELRMRLRRSSSVPEVAVIGAWEELADGWADLGIPVTGATRRELARSSGSTRARQLAGLVDSAVFAEHPPTRGFVVRAWQLSDDERRRVAADRPRWRRLLAAVNPLSLWRSVRVGADRPFELAEKLKAQLTGRFAGSRRGAL